MQDYTAQLGKGHKSPQHRLCCKDHYQRLHFTTRQGATLPSSSCCDIMRFVYGKLQQQAGRLTCASSTGASALGRSALFAINRTGTRLPRCWCASRLSSSSFATTLHNISIRVLSQLLDSMGWQQQINCCGYSAPGSPPHAGRLLAQLLQGTPQSCTHGLSCSLQAC